jgi:hypothetical protein
VVGQPFDEPPPPGEEGVALELDRSDPGDASMPSSTARRGRSQARSSASSTYSSSPSSSRATTTSSGSPSLIRRRMRIMSASAQ